MSATVLYRIASVLLLLFALGHTAGFLRLVPPSPEALAVRDSMNNVHFQVGGRDSSYGNFYRGFGLFNSIFLLFSAVLAWHLGTLAATAPQAIGFIGWAFCLAMLGNLALCWAYFNVVAISFSAVLALCLGWAAWIVGSLAAARS
ncbi:MAG: hypothetical protein JOZ10_13880 [Acidobacteria bacterium]|nr:hypothetical protein [Acidobacteriota bacterium]MBV9145870.1 hypothetical protein [Acidobacteriota bacterium]MBV9436687.1 hypothetical protein [Acidobacteriota bacterium]